MDELESPNSAVADIVEASATTSPPVPSHVEPVPDVRAHICIISKQLPEAVGQATEALALYNRPPRFFVHNGKVVRVIHHDADIALDAVGVPELQGELTRAARWTELTEKRARAIYPPSIIVRDILHQAETWAPTLKEVVRVPVFGAEWRLLDEPRFHASDGLLYRPNHSPIPPVPQCPSQAEVAEARRLICLEMLGDFPFVSNADRAAAIAPLILPFVRHRIDGATPLHLIDSPQPGSGKTLLADVVSLPALGKVPPANTEIRNGDDLRKWVTAMALAGENVVLIDNVNSRLGGSALAAALTKVEWSDRIVGTSQQAKALMRWVWLATGNNVVMSGELARRVVRSRIDSGVERPHLRRGFRHADIREWVKANRSSLIWAVLTLVRHWLACGRPEGQTILGSFESYCRVIGGILHAAGIDGFLVDVGSASHQSDDETIEWSAFIQAWHVRFKESVVGATALDNGLLAINPEMLATSLAGATSERGRRIKLGQELRKRRDAIVCGWRIRVSDGVDGHGCWSYWLESSTSISTAGSETTSVEADASISAASAK